ncbi:hypothetical protein D3C78_1860900 [compost metagenome]
MLGLLIEVREVGEQQHHGDDQDGEQPPDQRAAAHAGEQIACVEFFHRLAPAWTFHTETDPK